MFTNTEYHNHEYLYTGFHGLIFLIDFLLAYKNIYKNIIFSIENFIYSA